MSQVHEKALSIPGRAMPGVIGFLGKDLEEQDRSVLVRMHKLVVDALKTGKDDETANDLAGELDKCLPLLRSVCGL